MRFNKKQNFFAGCVLAMSISATHAAEFGLFGDISFQESTRSNHDGSSHEESFALGSLTLHASQEIDEKTTGFIEYTIKSPSSAVAASHAVSIERLWIKRSITPTFQIGAGQFHSSLGYWNQAYHHGKLTQDTVTRPFFINLRDAKSIFPAHVLGLKATGILNIAHGTGGSVSYDLAIANGTSIDTTPPATEGPIPLKENFSEKKLAILRTSYQFPVRPIQIGIFGMINPVAESISSQKLVDQTVLGMDLHIVMNHFEITAEYFRINNKDSMKNTGKYTADAYYVQLGYWLISNNLKSIYRYESLGFDKNDPYFQYRRSTQERRHTLALRYEIDGTNALTLEAQRTTPEEATTTNNTETDYYLQWAFMMF